MRESKGTGVQRPRRRFGQHFLIDPSVVEATVASLGGQRDRCLVEIGPGRGALTAALLEAFDQVDVVEIDTDLVEGLPARLGHPQGLHIHLGDALKFDFRSLHKPPGKLTVVGNLPYNISTPLLFHLLSQRDCVEEMVFMLQLEVVQRMVCGPGSGAYGRLSIMTQLHCETEQLFEVPPSAFSPPPRVDSAVVSLKIRNSPVAAIDDLTVFDEIVRLAFAQRRKTLRNALRTRVTVEQLEVCGIDAGRRAETLHLVELARLSNEVSR